MSFPLDGQCLYKADKTPGMASTLDKENVVGLVMISGVATCML